MPVTEGKYQCTHCDDIFEANSQEYSKCQCGMSEIQLRMFGYSYKPNTSVKSVDHNTYYCENEFVKLPNETLDIIDEIKKIKEATGYKYYIFEMFNNGKNGEKYLHQINLECNESVNKYSSERNSISLTVSLDIEDYKGDEVTKVRLQRFLDFMKNIEDGKFDLSKRSEMIELANKEEIYYTEEPTGDTNYTFYL